MMQLKRVIIEHKFAIVLAVLASLLVAFPQIYFRIDHKNDGVHQGVEMIPDSPWSARVAEVQNGHPNFGAIYYKDGKDNPYLFQPLGSMVVGYMGKALSLDINDTLLLSRLFLTLLVFLLMYGFVFLLSKDKLAALSSAAVLVFAESILNYSGILNLLNGVSPDDFLRMARPVNPAMIYILLFGFLIPFWIFYKDKKWQYGIASAVFLGLNFYNYFYSWTYLYAFGGLLFLCFLIQRNWREVVRIGSVFGGALLLTIPYAINLYRATQHPAYEEASVRFGVVATHDLLFVGFVVIGILVAFLLWFPREDKEKYFFGLSLLLTPFVTMNQQIITGKVLQANHYHWFFHKPMAVIFAFIIIFYILARFRSSFYKRAVAVAVIVVSVFVGMFIQGASYASGENDGGSVLIERQKYGPVVKWLNQNAAKESVVLANNEMSHITVIYTPLNVFYHRAAMYSLAATKERLLDVLFAFYRLRGVSEDDVREVFFAERGYISANIYGMHYRELSGSYEAIPDEKIEEIIVRYKETLSISRAEWIRQKLAKYEVEYVVWDRKNDPFWQLDKYRFLNKAVEFGDFSIYRFNQ